MKKLNGFIQTDLGLNSALVIFPAQGPWPLWLLVFLHCKKPTTSYGFIYTHTYVYISYILQNLIKAHQQYQFNSTTFNNTNLILVKRGAGEPRERCPRKLRKNRKTTWIFTEVSQLTRDPLHSTQSKHSVLSSIYQWPQLLSSDKNTHVLSLWSLKLPPLSPTV